MVMPLLNHLIYLQKKIHIFAGKIFSDVSWRLTKNYPNKPSNLSEVLILLKPPLFTQKLGKTGSLYNQAISKLYWSVK